MVLHTADWTRTDVVDAGTSLVEWNKFFYQEVSQINVAVISK